jgi:Protein of unknown function (DUF3592)
MLDQMFGVLAGLTMMGFGLFLGAVSIMWIISNVGDYITSVRSKRWLLAQGRIVSSESEWIGARARSLRPAITYAYEVGGTVYQGKRIIFGNINTYLREDVEQLLKDYAVGVPATVYYDPGNPHNSTLRRTHRGLVSGLIVSAMLLLPTCLCLVAGGIGLSDIFRAH